MSEPAGRVPACPRGGLVLVLGLALVAVAVAGPGSSGPAAGPAAGAAGRAGMPGGAAQVAGAAQGAHPGLLPAHVVWGLVLCAVVAVVMTAAAAVVRRRRMGGPVTVTRVVPADEQADAWEAAGPDEGEQAGPAREGWPAVGWTGGAGVRTGSPR
jgi:hypothetical protein